MKELVDGFVSSTTSFLIGYGPIAGVLLIIVESIIPMLPLSVFITLNMVSYGNVFGLIISWLSTVVGCMLSFLLFRFFLQKKWYRFIKRKDSEMLKTLTKKISSSKFSSLVTLIALPFSPAFLINIASGISHMKIEKFFLALLLGKIVMVYFWGYIGTSLLESLTDITIMIKIFLLLTIVFIISRKIEKKWKVR